MPVELYMLDKLKARIQLAREIDGLQHKVKKEKHERNWLKEAAEAMEIELDSDLARCVPGPSFATTSSRADYLLCFHNCIALRTCAHSDSDDEDKAPSKQKQRAAGAKVAALKAQLKAMLAQPLVARGVSTRYITSGVRSIADDLIAGECASVPFSLVFCLSLLPIARTSEFFGSWFWRCFISPLCFSYVLLLLCCSPPGRSTFRVSV